MQPFIAAMQKVRQAFLAAIIKSFLRTKHVLQTILNIWISPSVIKDENGSISSRNGRRLGAAEFVEVVENAFRGLVGRTRLVALSDGLRKEFLDSMYDNPLCMLPSYNHQLPSGEERGTFLALDVGGSTFRVALIELSGRKSDGQECKILKRNTFKIDRTVKQLKGVLFFDWMAERIEEVLSGQAEGHDMSNAPLTMGLAWSFPIEQTSLRSGLLQAMGKGFLAAHGLLGQDLGDLIQESCSRRGLNVQLNAIVNDSSATLLSKAYIDPATRFALILGTGVNAAVHLPVHVFSPPKFGVRPPEWHNSAKHVIVNTELSMFGRGILPYTQWDELLLSVHPNPTFQPLEHFVSGGYLGEIVRLVLVEGIQTAGLFGGVVPPSLRERYSLETETLSHIESDLSPNLTKAQAIFLSRHPTNIPPSTTDLQTIRLIAAHVTHRAAGVVAAGVHALWQLRNEAESILPHESSHTLVAYNGSVLENYPGFKVTCQKHLDTLVEASGGKKGSIELMYAEESSLLGAAVAGAVASLDG
ncbi:probable hexokinase-1 [Phialocephala subalpina]|uniref:Phosphotransferase n=1 Tax=Phialocephala subalpina TaxID=576137 RepID=A0A1L7X842_9HELO|nr:probable hexokinase-1 [Phialocephala subalpina]